MPNALRNGFAASVVFLVMVLVSLASAQMVAMPGNGTAPRGVPASVTSFGFGGHPGFHGVPASVTSQGFGANNNFRGVPGHITSFGFGAQNGFDQRPFLHGRRRIHQPIVVVYSPYYAYAPYPYPYYLNDDYSDSAAYQDSASDYRDGNYRENDGREVLDQDYRAELNRPKEQSSERNPEPVASQPSTVLVFKDGHQQEISNYAIVGGTLYDLSDGRSKKLPLIDLDLTATVKENDQRGVEFQVPAQAHLN